MEPPAVGSSRIGLHGGSNNVDKNRRDLMLRIDSQYTYASCSRAFEELPENFLETVSPQQTNSHSCLEINFDSTRHVIRSPSLSPGLPIEHKFDTSNADSSHKPHGHEGAGGLLSVVDSPPPADELVDCKPLAYVKEESQSPEYRPSECESMYISSGFDHDLNVSNVHSPVSQDGLSSGGLTAELREPKPEPIAEENNRGSSYAESEKSSKFSMAQTAELLLNHELDDNLFIDTKDLCKKIAFELKQHSIPQAVFAEKVLCRSQGTLSDLLRNPKPWNKLKSGRETFRRMFNWMQQPLHVRLSILDMSKDGEESPDFLLPSSPPTPAPNKAARVRPPSVDNLSQSSSYKKPRLVFTDVQKRTLQAIFKETQRPSREMQQTIADHLQLETATVANYFMNQRRRTRGDPSAQQDSESNNGDS